MGLGVSKVDWTTTFDLVVNRSRTARRCAHWCVENGAALGAQVNPPHLPSYPHICSAMNRSSPSSPPTLTTHTLRSLSPPPPLSGARPASQPPHPPLPPHPTPALPPPPALPFSLPLPLPSLSSRSPAVWDGGGLCCIEQSPLGHGGWFLPRRTRRQAWSHASSSLPYPLPPFFPPLP